MGKVTGFKEYKREDFGYQRVGERITHFKEFTIAMPKDDVEKQAARCMECGVPFCHSSYGCPLANIIPQFNDLIYTDKWESAFRNLMSTNNFPEFTGRVCPAICETACVLGINDEPVAIKNIEYAIIEKAYEKGWMKTLSKEKQTGKKVAIIGSGPAGLAAADQLNKAGHEITVYEKDKRIGGLLRYGIPNFKLDKKDVVQRRIDIMIEEGINFIPEVNVGVDISINELDKEFDAIIVCIGAGKPRDLPIINRDAKGIHFAMDFLAQNNSILECEIFNEQEKISAKGKKVLVIGGGDTGSDCVGTSIRQGAKSVMQIELLSKPPLSRTEEMPWPKFPRIFKLSTSQSEGCDLEFDVLSKSFIKNETGHLIGVNCVKIKWDGQNFKEIDGSEFVIEADLVLLAMGFVGPSQDCVIENFNLKIDQRTNIEAINYKTSVPKIFSCGDSRRGQSLIVWAIFEGRECAVVVDEFLMNKKSMLNRSNKSLYEL